MGKEITVLHIPDGHVFDEDGVITPTYRDKPIVMNSSKRYHNCLYLLAGLSPAARNLMDFLVEEMTEENIVYNNKIARQKFIDFMNTINYGDSKTNYSDQTVKEAFSAISKTKLIEAQMRGVFRVNPEYFFKVEIDIKQEAKRIGDIMKIELEFLPEGTKIKTSKRRG